MPPTATSRSTRKRWATKSPGATCGLEGLIGSLLGVESFLRGGKYAQIRLQMLGLLHKCLFELIEREKGAEALAEVKADADIPAEKIFRVNQLYSTDEWERLFDAASEALGLSADAT